MSGAADIKIVDVGLPGRLYTERLSMTEVSMIKEQFRLEAEKLLKEGHKHVVYGIRRHEGQYFNFGLTPIDDEQEFIKLTDMEYSAGTEVIYAVHAK